MFVGDSRIRQLYESFLSQLESRSAMTQEASAHPHTDLSFGDAQLRLRVQFVWSPVVSRHMVEKFNEWKVRVVDEAQLLQPSLVCCVGSTRRDLPV